MKCNTVLVTGANGFIGSNLIKRLNKMNTINVIKFNRDSNFKALEKQIESVDFIFHFAGEVSPKSSNNDFKKSNVILTKSIIEIIEKKGKKIPLVMASSIHAESQKNAYGKTKREAELYLEEYGRRNDISVWIYRLPHVFGEGCKANYNSVISTWIYNSIRDKEIVIFDRAIPMTYVYVQDLVDEFIQYLNYKRNKRNVSNYISPQITYDTTLGEIVDYIEEFKSIDKVNHVKFNEFKEKLFITYQDYYKNMVV